MGKKTIETLKKLKAIKERLDELSKKEQDLDKKGSCLSFDEGKELFTLERIWGNSTSKISSNLLSNLKNIDDIYKLQEKNNMISEYTFKNNEYFPVEHINLINPKNNEDKEAIKKFSKEIIEKKKKYNDSLNDTKLDEDAKEEKTKEYSLTLFNEWLKNQSDFIKHEVDELKFKKHKKTVSDLYQAKNYEDLEKLVNDAAIDNANIDDLMPEDELFLDSFNKADYHISYPYKDKLEKLKENASLEESQLLDEANEFLKVTDSQYVGECSMDAEFIGKHSDKILAIEEEKFYKEKGFPKEKGVRHNSDFSIGSYDKVDTADVNNHLLKQKVTLNQKDIDEIAKLCEDIYKINSDGKFTVIRETKENLNKAVESGNKEEIIEATKIYKENKEKVDDIIKRIEKMGDNSTFPGNHSYARNDSIPKEYRDKIRELSIFRSISENMHAFKFYGIDIKKFLSNPVEGIIDASTKLQQNGVFANHFKNDKVYDSVNELIDHQNQSLYTGKNTRDTNLDDNFILQLTKFIPSIQGLLGSKNREFLCVGAIGVDGWFKKSLPFFQNPIIDSVKIAGQLAMLEPEDRTIDKVAAGDIINGQTGQVDKFDIKKYIESGKTTTRAITSRLIDCINNFSKKSERYKEEFVEKSVDILVNSLGRDNIDKEDLKYLDAIKNNTLDKIPANHQAYYQNVSKTDSFIAAGDKNADFKDISKSIHEMQKQYDSRWWFMKLWGKNTKDLKAKIDTMVNNMKEFVGEDKFNELHGKYLESVDKKAASKFKQEVANNKGTVKDDSKVANEKESTSKLLDIPDEIVEGPTNSVSKEDQIIVNNKVFDKVEDVALDSESSNIEIEI